MAFFKSKAEREIEAKMQMEEQLQVFNDQISSLEGKRSEYAAMAAEAELGGDQTSYDTALNALLDLNDTISVLKQSKMNYDIISVSNATGVVLAKAMNALDIMANGKVTMPNMKKILKTQTKLNSYLFKVKKAQKGMSFAMKQINPANRARSPEEKESARAFIDAARSKISPTIPRNSVMAEIEKEKSKLY